VEAEYPNISQGDLMKELGKRWKELSDVKREEYKRQYEEAKKRVKRNKKVDHNDDAALPDHLIQASVIMGGI
jgi:hypothetical protein